MCEPADLENLHIHSLTHSHGRTHPPTHSPTHPHTHPQLMAEAITLPEFISCNDMCVRDNSIVSLASNIRGHSTLHTVVSISSHRGTNKVNMCCACVCHAACRCVHTVHCMLHALCVCISVYNCTIRFQFFHFCSHLLTVITFSPPPAVIYPLPQRKGPC